MRRFQFELARELGMTHGQLIRSMSSRELTEWQAYYKLKADPSFGLDEEAKLRKVFGGPSG